MERAGLVAGIGDEAAADEEGAALTDRDDFDIQPCWVSSSSSAWSRVASSSRVVKGMARVVTWIMRWGRVNGAATDTSGFEVHGRLFAMRETLWAACVLVVGCSAGERSAVTVALASSAVWAPEVAAVPSPDPAPAVEKESSESRTARSLDNWARTAVVVRWNERPSGRAVTCEAAVLNAAMGIAWCGTISTGVPASQAVRVIPGATWAAGQITGRAAEVEHGVYCVFGVRDLPFAEGELEGAIRGEKMVVIARHAPWAVGETTYVFGSLDGRGVAWNGRGVVRFGEGVGSP